jgi:mediator of RNA polymerase II transcription subunit 17
MATYPASFDALVFPYQQHTRLRVSLSISDSNGVQTLAHNSTRAIDNVSVDGLLKAAQEEVVEQEIFSVLVREASSLPTVSARVSERLIVIDAAQGLELQFELVL